MHINEIISEKIQQRKIFLENTNLPSSLVKKIKQWTTDGFHFLGPEDITLLKEKFPYKGGKLYRGLNFKTQESFDKFWEESKQGTIYPGDTWSSWTPHKNEAWAFAITWPTYHLNYELMHAEDQKYKNRDYMIGYQGLVITVDVSADTAVDLRATGYAHESEIILPTGEYPMEVINNLKPFKREIDTQSIANKQLLSITTLSNENDFNRKKFIFIMQNFTNFSKIAKKHLQNLLLATLPKEPIIKIDPIKRAASYGEIDEDIVWIRLYDNMPRDIIAYYPLLSTSGKTKIKIFVDAIMKEKINQITNLFKSKEYDWSKAKIEDTSKSIESIASPSLVTRYQKLFKTRFTTSYKNLDNMVQQINSTNDQQEQKKLIDAYTERMVNLIKNIQNV